ncbi:hypothetical protein [Falsirhodobacter sp. alg1]|uniref:hypothetical protein n=1 Tax=Falsirhodobacter sp. alg1 TaxID=1472418 RepID=UPI00351C55F8
MFDESHLTEDGFLDGRLRILQPRDGYRAATDPVFLAAAVPAKQGDLVTTARPTHRLDQPCTAQLYEQLLQIGQ